MSKDRVVEMKATQATRERDLVIRSVRDELVQFMSRKFAKERGRELEKLGPDVFCMVQALAEGMAILHVDVIRSLANGDQGSYERKLAMALEREEKK
jgi:NAD-dependent oxidoreductase involved in siderophore biosynthesis